MTTPTEQPTPDAPLSVEGQARRDFCARFVAQMIKAAPIYDGSEADLRAYAEETAPTYYDDLDQREDGPEECARADISYWEEG